MLHVICRRRDETGTLIRREVDGEELPPWVEVDGEGQRVVRNPTSFVAMFCEVKERQGLEKNTIKTKWQDYLKQNPGLAKLYRAGL